MIGRLYEPLVAQCIDTGPCELPTGLPWYFGLPIAAVWFGAVVGALLLGRRFLARRIERRRSRDDGVRAIERTSAGTDLERW